jgi:hypothetical protein
MFHSLAELSGNLSTLYPEATNDCITTPLSSLYLRLIGIARLRTLLALRVLLYVLNIVIICSPYTNLPLNDHASSRSCDPANDGSSTDIRSALLDWRELHIATNPCILIRRKSIVRISSFSTYHQL